MPAQQPDGDLLVGYDTVHAFLVRLGMPEHVDLYYLRRTRRWPIGNTGGRCTGGGKLIASKRQLTEYVNEITSGSPLGRNLLASKLRIGRLSAWQNWIFNRPNASGPDSALCRFGTGQRAVFDRKRV